MSKIRVLLADDHSLFREGLRSLLEDQKDVEVVGEARDGLEAARLAPKVKPSVVLMDINMPVLDGVEATRIIVRNNPAIGVIVLTMHPQDEYVFEALKAGAKGYLLKDTSSKKLMQVIQSVHRGQAVIDADMTTRLLGELYRMADEDKKESEINTLTDQEYRILTLLATGASNRDIAEDLHLSERTIKNCISVILGKLRVTNRTEAAILAVKEGLISLK